MVPELSLNWKVPKWDKFFFIIVETRKCSNMSIGWKWGEIMKWGFRFSPFHILTFLSMRHTKKYKVWTKSILATPTSLSSRNYVWWNASFMQLSRVKLIFRQLYKNATFAFLMQEINQRLLGRVNYHK